MAYFIGVICGDGYVSPHGSIIEIKDEYQEFLTDIYTPIVTQLFGKIPRTTPESNNKNAFRCYFNSIHVVNLLKGWHIVSPKTFSVCMPFWIKESNIQTKINFVRGAMDTDGDVSVKKNKSIINYPTVKFGTRSPRFAEDIFKIFLEIGLKARFTRSMNRDKLMYLVRLYGFEQLKDFVEKVGFRHPFKNARTKKILHDGIVRASRSTV